MLALAPTDDQSPPRVEPASLDDVFEVVTRAVFQAGLHWAVVDRRWPAFERELEGFDVHAVAAYADDDVDRLCAERQLIRNRVKWDATVANARALLEVEREHGSFAEWLGDFEDHEAARDAMCARFTHLGAFGATWVLWVLGGPTPPHAEWSRLGGAR